MNMTRIGWKPLRINKNMIKKIGLQKIFFLQKEGGWMKAPTGYLHFSHMTGVWTQLLKHARQVLRSLSSCQPTIWIAEITGVPHQTQVQRRVFNSSFFVISFHLVPIQSKAVAQEMRPPHSRWVFDPQINSSITLSCDSRLRKVWFLGVSKHSQVGNENKPSQWLPCLLDTQIHHFKS